MNILQSEFTCPRERLTIRGTLYRREADNQPIVIISHGFMANRKSVKTYAMQFAAWGYAAFTFDFNGGSIVSQSTGKSTDMSVFTEVKDLLAVIRYAKEQDFVNPDRLTLMGCSQGGFVSAMTAAQLQSEVTRLILFYPALCIPDDARRGQMIFAKFDPDHIPDTMRCGLMKLGYVYPESVIDRQFEELIDGYDGPVLLVHGTADNLVPISYSRKACAFYRSRHPRTEGLRKIQLLEIQEAPHGFKKRHDAVAIPAIREFLKGRSEVLTIDVHLTGHTMEREGKYTTLTLPFDGKAIGPWFTGDVQPGAADVQQREGTKPIRFCADYTICGRDYTGEPASVHVVNVFDGQTWTPTVSTDSKALSFLNGAVCSAELEMRKTGPIVHIYARAAASAF